MAYTWQFQEANNRFSEVIEEATKNGPQVIIRRGVETAVVLSFTDYQKIIIGGKTLSEFFRESPLPDMSLDLTCDTSPARDDIAL